MTIEWTGEAPELSIQLDRDGSEPLGDQLQAALREAITSGRLRAGERMPSSRALAAGLHVSRGLVVNVYEQLAAGGYLVSRPGGSTRVAETAPVQLPARDQRSPLAPRPDLDVDFAVGRPDLGSFPRREWLRALSAAAASAPRAHNGYVDAQGIPELRDVLACYLNRVRATRLAADDLVVCAGYTQGLRLVLEASARAGHRTVALEDPGHRGAREVAQRVGLTIRPVPVDEQGVDVTALAATDARMVVLTPAHQTPTGVVLSASRRQALVAWATERSALVIEDDYDAEFRYDRRAVDSMQGLAPGSVVTIGSVSKTLAPTLRLGWVGGPPSLVPGVVESKRLADHGSPGLDQFALATLLTSGRYDRHLRKMRGHYAARRQALVTALAAHAPQVRLTGLAAGFHAVAHLPLPLQERAVVEAAARRGVGLYPMHDYRLRGGDHPPQLVLGFGDLTVDAIGRGIARVADLLRG